MLRLSLKWIWRNLCVGCKYAGVPINGPQVILDLCWIYYSRPVHWLLRVARRPSCYADYGVRRSSVLVLCRVDKNTWILLRTYNTPFCSVGIVLSGNWVSTSSTVPTKSASSHLHHFKPFTSAAHRHHKPGYVNRLYRALFLTTCPL